MIPVVNEGITSTILLSLFYRRYRQSRLCGKPRWYPCRRKCDVKESGGLLPFPLVIYTHTIVDDPSWLSKTELVVNDLLRTRAGGLPSEAYLAFYGNRFSRFTRRKVNQPLQRLIDREYIQAMPSGQGSRRQKVVLDSSMHPGRPQCTGRPTGAISFFRQLFPLAILKGACGT